MADADVVFPRPCALPAAVPADSPLLAFAHYCPTCAERLVYAHCDAVTCIALACIACNVIMRPDLGTWFQRNPEQLQHPSQRPMA